MCLCAKFFVIPAHLSQGTEIKNRSNSQISPQFNPSQKADWFCTVLKKKFKKPPGHLNKVTQIISRSTENDSSIKQMYVENFHRAALAAAKPNLFSIHKLAA